MGSNVFVSYKYADKNVAKLGDNNETTCRDYVDELEELLKKNDIGFNYRGEKDGEDLSELNDDTVAGILADKIRTTSVTIVMVSSGMKEWKREKDQWIPWEISYSLKEISRETGKSRTNGILAVVIPDRDQSYVHAIWDFLGVRYVITTFLFKIITENLFNRKGLERSYGIIPYVEEDCYIPIVKWSDFVNDPKHYLNVALDHRDHSDEFNLVKEIRDDW
jgi:hypothetical protein